MNKVTLIGRLTRDIEIRNTSSGTSFGRFTLAVNRRFKSEGQPEADFISCTVWGKQAETMGRYLSKGSQIGVEGRIQTGSYQKDGQTVYTTDVVVENFDFLSPKNSNNNENAGYTPQDKDNGGYESDDSSSNDDDFPSETLNIASEDLPF